MILLKIGGGAAINLAAIANDIAELEEQVVIVHGANALRDNLYADLGKEKRVVTSLSGYSSVFTDDTAMDLILMSYAGLRNKRLVEMLQQKGVNAIGLSGIDGGLIRARRNRGIKVEEGGKKKILRDFSGKPREVNLPLLQLLLQEGYTPVLSIPLLDEDGFAVNSENDDIVAVLQNALQARCVVSLIEAPGFLEDKDDPESLVARLSVAELEAREEQVEGRMKRKLLALRKLFAGEETTVYLADGRVEQPLQNAFAGKGTTISNKK